MRNDLDFYQSSFTPFRNFNSLRENIGQLFEDILPVAGGRTGTGGFIPAVDLDETETDYLFFIDLPGVKIEDLKIEVMNNRLTVSGERAAEHAETKKNTPYFESRYGKFERSFMLPGIMDAKNIEANYENGVLSIKIPKTEEFKSRQIPIKEGKGFVEKLKKAVS